MINIIVTYKVKQDKIDLVLEAIKQFISNIKKNEPNTLVYEAFQKDDKVSFIHIMSFKDKKSEQIHRNSSYVKKFVSILYPNCEQQPVFTNLTLISSKR